MSGPRPVQPDDPTKPSAAIPAPNPVDELNKLYDRLAKTTDADEAQGIAGAINRAQMHSGSDTVDLLMSRALTALNTEDHATALALLDKVVALEPQWAEGWNKRATIRYLDKDDAGSINDISHVLALEPRHFGALSGLGFILQRNNLDKRALEVFRRTLEIYPALENVRKLVDQLTPAVEGQPI